MNTESPIIRQRTEEWYAARLGKFTASHFAELMARPLNRSIGWSKTSLSYIESLAIQIHQNSYYSKPNNDATRWGMHNEDMALKEFEGLTGFEVIESGFMLHPVFREAGATPDAFIIDNHQSQSTVVAQVKCPFNRKNHLKYARKIEDVRCLKKYKSAYYWQMQGEIWVTGATHSYFISFDPRAFGRSRLHYALIERDQNAIEKLECIIPEAVKLRDELVERLKENGK